MHRHLLLFRTSLAAALLIGLAGCAPIAKLVGPAPILSPAGQVQAARLEYDAEAAYIITGNAFLAVEPRVTPTVKATGKVLSARLHAALLAVRSAEDAGDAISLPARIRAFQSIAADLYAAIGQAPPATVVPACN